MWVAIHRCACTQMLLCVCLNCTLTCGFLSLCEQKASGARASRAKKGYLQTSLSVAMHNVFVPTGLCSSGIISFFQRFKSALLDGIKVETRRGWSNRTKNTSMFLERMQMAYEKSLFLRARCGVDQKRRPVVIGWLLITNMTRAKLGDMTVESVAREGYPGKSVEWFLEKEFRGLSVNTLVWIVSFVLLPHVC